MIVEHLNVPPTSGTVSERRYDAIGNCSWFLFKSNEGEVWAGVFGRGKVTRFSGATIFDHERSVFIIAGGQGYIIDSTSGNLLHKTRCDYLQSSIAIPSHDLIMACTIACSAFGIPFGLC
jgi:hypothetical protein